MMAAVVASYVLVSVVSVKPSVTFVSPSVYPTDSLFEKQILNFEDCITKIMCRSTGSKFYSRLRK